MPTKIQSWLAENLGLRLGKSIHRISSLATIIAILSTACLPWADSEKTVSAMIALASFRSDRAILVDVRDDFEVNVCGGVFETARHFPSLRARKDPEKFQHFLRNEVKQKEVYFYGAENVRCPSTIPRMLTPQEDRVRTLDTVALAVSFGFAAAGVDGSLNAAITK